MGEAMLDDEDEDANVDQLFREARKNAMQTNNEEYHDEEEGGGAAGTSARAHPLRDRF